MNQILFIPLFCLIMPFSVYSAPKNTDILLINSNANVEKYLFAQNTFVQKLTDKNVININLASYQHSISSLINKLKPKLIYTIGSSAYLSVLKSDPKRPIVFSSIVNWRRIPLTKHTTGVSAELLPASQLLLFRYFFPDIQRVGVLYSDTFNKEWQELAKVSAKEVGLTLVARRIHSKKSVKKILPSLLKKIDALWLIADPLVLSSRANIRTLFNMAEQQNKAVFAYDAAFIHMGAVLSIAVDPATTGRQAAVLSNDVLKNHFPPAVLAPAGSLITLNAKKLNALGLHLNEDALDSVNEVIE